MTPKQRTAAREHLKRLKVFAMTDTVSYLEMALDALETTDNLHQIAIDCAEDSVRRIAEEEAENNTQRDCIHKMQQHIDAQDKRIAELDKTTDALEDKVEYLDRRLKDSLGCDGTGCLGACYKCDLAVCRKRVASLERRIRAQQAWLTHCDETAPIHDCHWTCPDGSEGMPVCDDGKPIAAEYLASVEAAHCQC
jgi:septal ring factor EnvC (AmiA/AmiB activator)